jgi:arylsulfatase A-like enzyme
LLTGLYPWTHRVANLTSLELGTAGLPPAFITLAERFRDSGYRTAAFTDGGPLGHSWNLMQGFETLAGRFEGVTPKVDQTLAYFAADPGDKPLFTLLHTYEVHEPYLPPLEYVERFNTNPGYEGRVKESERAARALRTSGGETEPNGKILFEHKADFDAEDVRYLWDLYLGEVAYTDAELGRLFDALKASGRYDDMTILVTADHGEEFGEHGHFGHLELNRETLRVPMILKLPKGTHEEWRGKSVDVRVNQVDAHATLLSLLDADWPVDAGRSFFVDLGEGAFAARTSYAETTEALYGARVQFDYMRYQRSVRLGERAFIESEVGGVVQRELLPARLELEPLAQAPAPQLTTITPGPAAGDKGLRPMLDSLAGKVSRHLAQAAGLRAELLEGQSTSFVYKVDGETRSDLEALGYVEGDEESKKDTVGD